MRLFGNFLVMLLLLSPHFSEAKSTFLVGTEARVLFETLQVPIEEEMDPMSEADILRIAESTKAKYANELAANAPRERVIQSELKQNADFSCARLKKLVVGENATVYLNHKPRIIRSIFTGFLGANSAIGAYLVEEHVCVRK